MNHAANVLEFDQVLAALAHECETENGAESALGLKPSYERDVVSILLDETSEGHALLAEASMPALTPCRDFLDELNRASKGGTLNGATLYAVAQAMTCLRQVRVILLNRAQSFPKVCARVEQFIENSPLENHLFGCLDGDGELQDHASEALANLRSKKKGAQARIHERLHAHLSRSRSLLSDPIYTIRDGRYVIPVKAEYRGRIKGVVHDTSTSGQTLFVEPEDVLQAGNALRELEVQEQEEIRRILRMLSAKVGAIAEGLSTSLRLAWELDLLLAKARLAYVLRAARPDLRSGNGIRIHGGRHPLLAIAGVAVVPLDLEVGFGTPALLITGPNTGGKTVAIKTVGLFVLMAQAGLYVPALQCQMGPFSQVWADIGDEQSLQQNLSTFSGHLRNIAAALAQLKPGALALFDEIGAGTDPAEGSALAKAILNFLVAHGATIIASTHYGDLKTFAYEAPEFVNAAMEFDAKTLRPTYRLLMGVPGASQAMRIAERYGIPKDIVAAATEFLGSSERDTTALIAKLEAAQKQARIAHSEADRRLTEARDAEKKAQAMLSRAEEIREKALSDAQDTIDEALRQIRIEAAELFEDVRTAPNTKSKEEARGKLKEFDSRHSQKRFAAPKPVSSPQTTSVAKGQTVRVRGFSQKGTVVADPQQGKVEVMLGKMKIKVPVGDVTVVQEPKLASNTSRLTMQKASSARSEIHLRAMRAEDAQLELERFLDDAVLAGLDKVRIVHGKGEGILRQITQDLLKRYRDVKSFAPGDPEEGGSGVTIAKLK